MLDRLESQRREQERLLHEVIHELRTPLAVAGTNLELAGTAALDDDGAARIAAARRAIERMGRTVDDLAAHGRLSLGTGDGAVVDLAAEGRALVAEHHGPAAVQGLHLAAGGPDALPVPGDRSAIRTATSNLSPNALRVGPRAPPSPWRGARRARGPGSPCATRVLASRPRITRGCSSATGAVGTNVTGRRLARVACRPSAAWDSPSPARPSRPRAAGSRSARPRAPARPS